VRQKRVEYRLDLFHPLNLLVDLRPEPQMCLPEAGYFCQNGIGAPEQSSP
jgi:hypothetical protein